MVLSNIKFDVPTQRCQTCASFGTDLLYDAHQTTFGFIKWLWECFLLCSSPSWAFVPDHFSELKKKSRRTADAQQLCPKAQGDRCLCSRQNMLLSPANQSPSTELHLAHYLNTDNLSTAMQLHICKSILRTAYPLACFTSDSTNKERIWSITASQKEKKFWNFVPRQYKQ